jgi:hypothetical protein
MGVIVIAVALVTVMANDAAVGNLAGSAVVIVNAIGIIIDLLTLVCANAGGKTARTGNTHAAMLVVTLVLDCRRRTVRESCRA